MASLGLLVLRDPGSLIFTTLGITLMGATTRWSGHIQLTLCGLTSRKLPPGRPRA